MDVKRVREHDDGNEDDPDASAWKGNYDGIYDKNLLEVWRLAIENPSSTPMVRFKMMRSANERILEYLTRTVGWANLLKREFSVPGEWIQQLKKTVAGLNLRWLYNAFVINQLIGSPGMKIEEWINVKTGARVHIDRYTDYLIQNDTSSHYIILDTDTNREDVALWIRNTFGLVTYTKERQTFINKKRIDTIQVNYLPFTRDYTQAVLVYYTLFHLGYFPHIYVNEEGARDMTFILKSSICTQCNTQTDQFCGTCKQRAYCSVECQQKDWDAGHDATCGK